MDIQLPNWTRQRLIRESIDAWNLKHQPPADPKTSSWAEVYNAVLAFCRHWASHYDQALAAGEDRDQLHDKITTLAKAQYPWLRLGRDPRIAQEEPDAPETIYVQRSRELSELVSKKDHLIRSKFSLRKAFHPDYRQRVKTINAEIAQIEAKVAQMTKSFRINKGQIHGAQDLPVEFSIPDPPEYVFAGRRLAPNYIAPTGITCPECNRRVFRTKRPIDCGCGIKLMSFSCLCINVIVRPNYAPTLAGWEELLESRKSKAAGQIFEITQPVTFGLDD
jgi:hypothetical protein